MEVENEVLQKTHILSSSGKFRSYATLPGLGKHDLGLLLDPLTDENLLEGGICGFDLHHGDSKL